MYTSTLTRSGNSESVVIPKPLRERLGVSASEPVELDSPRENVVVLYFRRELASDRLERLERANRSNAALSAGKEWPRGGETAESLIDGTRGERVHGDYAL